MKVVPGYLHIHMYNRVSCRIFVKGGGANATIPELRGGGAKTIVCFSICEE